VHQFNFWGGAPAVRHLLLLKILSWDVKSWNCFFICEW
jgi:hypothetical protein